MPQIFIQTEQAYRSQLRHSYRSQIPYDEPPFQWIRPEDVVTVLTREDGKPPREHYVIKATSTIFPGSSGLEVV